MIDKHHKRAPHSTHTHKSCLVRLQHRTTQNTLNWN